MKLTSTLLALTCILLGCSQASYQVKSDTDCQTCQSTGSKVCRNENYDRYAFCCDVTEVGSLACGGADAFCTGDSKNPSIDAFVCPYSTSYCGAKTSEIVMHPIKRNNIKVEISNRLFTNLETCYYVVSVPSSDLEKGYRYFWDIQVNNRTNVRMTLNNGTALGNAGDPITVTTATGSRFQYVAENNKIFLSFMAQVSASSKLSALFSFTIKLLTIDVRPPPAPELKPSTEPKPSTNSNPQPTPQPKNETKPLEAPLAPEVIVYEYVEEEKV